jgi:endonuclease/exonuclease/phosphatase family metal-dependent hydrolase
MREGSLLRVATYNVHKCVGMDGKRDPERIARVVSELEADVVGLQEVDSWEAGGARDRQAQYLAEAVGMRAYTGPTISRLDARYGNVLLTRLPVLHMRRHDITYRGFEPRGVIDADVWTGRRAVRFVVTHLGLRRRERKVQTRWLLRILFDPPSCFEVLLGDMNEWLPVGAPLRMLNRRLGRTPHARSFPSPFPIFALDRVWARPADVLVETSVHRSPLARVASDHLPVLGTLALSG